jgi:hypothetical protein
VSADSSEDRELEQLLADAAVLRRGYRAAAQEEPPAALDAAIRAAAQRETRTRPRPAGSAFGTSWRIPASIAAVVVVSVTTAVMVVQRDTHLPLATQKSAPASAVDAGPAKDQAAVPTASGALKEKAEVETGKAELQAHPRADRTPASSVVPPAAPAGKFERSASHEVDTPIAPAAVELRQEPLRAQAQAQAEQKTPSSATAQPASPSANAAAPARFAPQSGVATGTADETVSVESLAKKQALPGPAGEADSSTVAWEKDPQAWLAHVEELRAAGRTEDAEASFQAFRRRYPDYRLPAGFVAPGR